MDNEEKRDQEELDELQDFDLDAILNEFHTDPEDAPPEDAPGIAPETGDIEAFDQELSQILQDFGEEPGEEQPSSLSETRIFSPAPSDAEKAAAAPGAEGHYQQIQYNGDLQAEYALIGKLVIPFFRTGNEFPL